MKTKNIKYIIITLFLVAVCFIARPNCLQAAKNGTVNKYQTTVSTNANGLLNIVYNIEIQFEADDIDEISIKLPNNNYAVQNKNAKISSITPSDNDYSIIKLANKYKAGDTVNLNFSLLHAHVYKKNNDELIYKITFGDIKNFDIQTIKVNWIKKNVSFSGLGIENDKYYVWERNYSMLRKFEVSVRYKQSNFKLTDNGELEYGIKEYFSNYGLIAIAAIVIIFEIILNIMKRRNRGW